jgi:hypothetical protein
MNPKNKTQKMQAWIQPRKRHHFVSYPGPHCPANLEMNPAKLGRIPSGRFRDFGRLIRRRRHVAEASHLALLPLTSVDLPTRSSEKH